jgi:hypothetical protein
MDRKIGVVQIASKRGFSILRVGPESSLERYFLHVSKIRSGTATPSVGMEVVFDVSDKPIREGDLPMAIRADIILPETQPEQVPAEPNAAPVDPEPAQSGKEGAL